MDAMDSTGISTIHLASEYGNAMFMHALLKGGADANATTNHGVVPLYLACKLGHHEIAEILIDAGAGVDAA